MLTKNKLEKNTKVAFDYTDPFRLTEQLTDEENQIKRLSSDFAKKRAFT